MPGDRPTRADYVAWRNDPAAFGPDQRFTFGLDVLLAGLEWQLRRGAAQD